MLASLKKYQGVLLRLIITVAGLAFVFTIVDVNAAIDSLLAMRLGWFFAALVVAQVGVVLRAWRWQTLLGGVGVHLGLGQLVKLYYEGLFFNLYLPTGFGGDVVRAVAVGRQTDDSTTAATVLLDRMIGLLVLFAIALALMPFFAAQVEDSQLLLSGIVSVVGIVGGALVLQGGILATLLNIAARFRLPGVGWAQRFNAKIMTVGRNRGALVRALGISVIFNAVLILMHVLLGPALGIDLPFVGFLLVVPITSLLSLVPTIQGLGMRESAWVLLTTPFGVDPGAALALGFSVYLLNLSTQLIGGVVYGIAALLPSARKPREKTEAA